MAVPKVWICLVSGMKTSLDTCKIRSIQTNAFELNYEGCGTVILHKLTLLEGWRSLSLNRLCL